MTNREKLLDELAGLSGGELYDALADNRVNTVIETAQCYDCQNINGGRCPHPEDNACALTVKEWMDLPCRADRLITEEALKR